MKKVFISNHLNSIMSSLVKFENNLKMIHKSKGARVIRFSFTGFCFGLVFTLGMFFVVNRVESSHGIGGFETSSVPEFRENIESILSETSEQTSSESVVPQSLITESSLLTYQTYRVKPGDMIGFIADRYNVTQDTIISVNNIKQSRLIQVGQYLKIPSMPGIIYTVRSNGETPSTIAEKYKVDSDKCALVNAISTSTELSAGTSIFVPDASLDWMTRQEINGDLFHKPLHGRYWLTSNYGWRDSPFSSGKRTFHGGLDMAISAGTPIYAALDGKVTAAGYNATYGNYVIITHHSGYKTLYGHMSRITCKKGNFVYTNTKIGEVGSTGMSTGPHLHFTVYKNGKTVNPAALIN